MRALEPAALPAAGLGAVPAEAAATEEMAEMVEIRETPPMINMMEMVAAAVAEAMVETAETVALLEMVNL